MNKSDVKRPSRDDLWAAAVASLSKEDRLHIDFQRSNNLDVLSDMLQLTNNEIQRAESGRLRYKRKNGETVIIKDLFGKVVKWIDHFKRIGDVVVQYDPTHAVLPWGGVRFLLEVAVSDVKATEFILEHATILGEIICRYAVFEDLFLRAPSSAASELERALLCLYSKVMLYLAKSKAYFHDHTIKRSMKNALLITPEFASYFEAIESAQVDVDRCTKIVEVQDQLDRHEELKNLLSGIDTPVARATKTLDEIKDDLDVAKRTKILQWISQEPYDSHHKQTRKDVLEGTGQWLLTDPTYLKWKKDSASSILWLHGIPGSGKTKLVSIVIDEVLKSYDNGLCPPPVFFYCSRNPVEPDRSQPHAIIASILRQLACVDVKGSLLQPIISAYKDQEKRGFTQDHLDLEESRDLILQLLPLHAMATIVIDALDECNPETRHELFDALEIILQESSTLVKIFVSSRDDQDIVSLLGDYPNLELSSARNSDDISRFVETETARLVRRKSLLRYSAHRDELKTVIINKISEGANGMFRWAYLQLQALCQQKTDQAIRERIGKLPPKLEDLYQELIERIEQNRERADRQYARNALSWLLTARENLPSEDFLIAISRHIGLDSAPPTKGQILDLCCNLITFDPILNRFRCAHLSVREFLENHENFQTQMTNLLAAESCLLSLIGSIDTRPAQKFVSQRGYTDADMELFKEIYAYSARYWGSHCRQAGDERLNDSFQHLLRYFLSNESDKASPFSHWSRYIMEFSLGMVSEGLHSSGIGEILGETGSSIFAVCRFDLVEILRSREQEIRQCYNTRTISGDTCVEVAMRHLSHRCLSVLLKDNNPQQIEVGLVSAIRSMNAEDFTVFMHNQRWNGVQITASLIRNIDAASNRQLENLGIFLGYQDHFRVTEELIVAAIHWFDVHRVVRLLLQHRWDHSQPPITERVLVEAARGWDKHVMTLLLEHSSVNHCISEKMVLAAATDTRSLESLRLLLPAAEQHAISDSVIVRFCQSGNKRALKPLLSQQEDEIPIRPMIRASVQNLNHGLDVTKFLTDYGKGHVKVTEDVLMSAAMNLGPGQEKVLTFLLDQQLGEIKITEGIVKAAAKNPRSGAAAMEALFTYLGDCATVSEEVVLAASQNNGGYEIMKVLLNRQHHVIPITEDVWIAAAGSNDASNLIKLLLERGIGHVRISEDMLLTAAANTEDGGETLEVFLDKLDPEVQITQEVLLAAAHNINGFGNMARLFVQDPIIPLSETIMVTIAQNDGDGLRMMDLLLDSYLYSHQPTGELVKAVCGNETWAIEMLTLLMDRCEDQVEFSEDAIRIAASNSSYARPLIALILEHHKTEFRLSDGVLKAAVQNHQSGVAVIELFMERFVDHIQITDEIFEAAVRHGTENVIALLLDNFTNQIYISASCIESAAGYNSGEVLLILLDYSGGEFQVTKGIVAAAAGNKWYGQEIMELLIFRQRGGIPITSETVRAIGGNRESGYGILQLLVQRCREGLACSLTESALLCAARSGQTEMLDLFCELGCIPTEEHLSIANLYIAAEDGDLTTVNELLAKGVYADHPDGDGRTPLSQALEKSHVEIAQVLLKSGRVNVDSRDKEGRSPIFYALLRMRCDMEMIRVLLEANASLEIRDEDGYTPESWAREMGNYGKLRYLKRKLGR